MMTHYDDVREAKANANAAWREALRSVEKFVEAEAVFADSTRAFRKKHGVPDGQPMTVECVLDRAKDAVWQESVTDCRYQRERTAMFAQLYQASVLRYHELTESGGIHRV